MGSAPDILIVGGGVIGLSLADALAERGARVALLERGSVAREASAAAAGLLAPQSEMEEPGPYLDFCLASRRMFPDLVARLREETGIDARLREEGMIRPAPTEAEERMLLSRAEWQTRAGLRARVLALDEARAIEPALAPLGRVAVHFLEDHSLEPRALCAALAASAARRGAELVENEPVAGLLREDDAVTGVRLARGGVRRAGRVVLAAGCWSRLLSEARPDVPVEPVKGQVIALRLPAPIFRHSIHDSRVYLAPRHDGRVVIGATEEHGAGFDRRVTPDGLLRLLDAARDLVPALGDATFEDAWAGLRPGTPDRRPILGPSGIRGLDLATGHFRNGILLAPITAARMSDWIATGRLAGDVGAFSVERFAG